MTKRPVTPPIPAKSYRDICENSQNQLGVQVKDLKLHSEIPLRAVHQLKFSFGGHLLAAIQGKLIHIFSVRTLTKVGTTVHFGSFESLTLDLMCLCQTFCL